MIIQVICVILVSFIVYRQGIRYLFKSRIMDNNKKADHFAYTAFMITGVIVGSYFTLSFLHNWFPATPVYLQIIVTFVSCILIGEGMYHRNKNLIYKIISFEEKKEKK
ncbi:hypothetical protein [Caldalkalibacillus mannanilyticus]|uniref:hypothetical protein n=1 Tax=Caldalkalibacillus mannanilyticus TaxID=1418 RepID=UPI0004680875|nr:hypothetical protein [Caldalkalibacillus mannanilyticus]